MSMTPFDDLLGAAQRGRLDADADEAMCKRWFESQNPADLAVFHAAFLALKAAIAARKDALAAFEAADATLRQAIAAYDAAQTPLGEIPIPKFWRESRQ